MLFIAKHSTLLRFKFNHGHNSRYSQIGMGSCRAVHRVGTARHEKRRASCCTIKILFVPVRARAYFAKHEKARTKNHETKFRIPVSSATSQRIFSSSGKILNEHRTRFLSSNLDKIFYFCIKILAGPAARYCGSV